MIVVSDTTALTTLMKAGLDSVLERLFGKVAIPEMVAIELRHDDVAQDDIGQKGEGLVDGQPAVAGGDDLEFVGRERQLDNLLNRDAVVGEEQFFSHFGLVRPDEIFFSRALFKNPADCRGGLWLEASCKR